MTSFDSAGFRAALLAQFTDAQEATITATAASVNVKAVLLMSSAASAASAASAIASTTVGDMQSDWFAAAGVSHRHIYTHG